MFEGGKSLDLDLDIGDCLARWPRDERLLLLQSGRFHRQWARWSIVARPRGVYQVRLDPGRICASRISPDGIRAAVRQVWRGPDDVWRQDELSVNPFHNLATLPSRGKGIWIGYLGYDLGRWGERMPIHPQIDRDLPLAEMNYCTEFLIYDAANETWQQFGDWDPHDFLTPTMRIADAADSSNNGDEIFSKPSSNFTRSAYDSAIRRALDYIASGDIFQVNLSQRFSTHARGPQPQTNRTLYARLAAQSPAWYGGYLECHHNNEKGVRHLFDGGAAIASISPELFFDLDAAGRVITRPIKGTRPASIDRRILLESEKDAAELAMIVDLLRNDLGRVCDYGSIRVTQPRTIETHPTVHHGVATIEARLHSSKNLGDLLRATLPGGSITGAPKIRAMQIIDELEPHARGPYCGAMGFVHRERACFNIAIRTMTMQPTADDRTRIDFCTGGGIVADSTPAGEYEETLHKAAALFAALRNDSTITATAPPVPHRTRNCYNAHPSRA